MGNRHYVVGQPAWRSRGRPPYASRMNFARDPADLPPDVVQLLLDYADSVPQLEALQLIWEGAETTWTADSVGARLYIPVEEARTVLRDLDRKGLLAAQDETYSRPDDPAAREIARQLVQAYRSNLSAVARLIHARPSASVRDFARAFRIKEEK
jgi:hypothetical protein